MLFTHHVLFLSFILLTATVASFSLKATSNSVAEPSSTNSRRVFVGGLQCADPERLQLVLEERYGPIESIFVLRETSANPYAFVNFRDASDAQRAIGDCSDLYKEIKTAQAIAPHKRQKSAQRKDRARQDYESKRRIARESTTLLQIQKSHRERVQDFLAANGYPVTGSYSWSSVAMVGVQADSTELQQFFETLEPTIPIFHCAVIKLYGVDPTRMVVQDPDATAAHHYYATLLESSPVDARVRLNVFPPAIAPQLIRHLQEERPELLTKLSPTDYTHALAVVKIPTQDNNTIFWCLGMREERNVPQVQHYDDDRICRAQSKLQEAFARYNYSLSTGKDLVAVDCGAAPGGWTQFLANNPHVQCRKIYSIDPGELDPIVLANEGVEHLQLKVVDAMKEISRLEASTSRSNNNNNPVVHLWVSDMCLHEMSDQVDQMLDAKRQGIVGTGTFFVLTLKCNQGHSSEAFDKQVAQQCDRLQGICQNLQTLHLFSNRSGERTVMGYLK